MKPSFKPIILFVGLILLSAWSARPAFNTVSNARISTSTSTTSNGIIPSYYTYYIMGSNSAGASLVASVGSSVQGVALTGLSKKGYSHIMVMNNTSTEIALANVQSGITTESIPRRPMNGVPNDTTGNTFHVLANNTAAWDDVSIFDTLFIKSTGSSISSGNVNITVW